MQTVNTEVNSGTLTNLYNLLLNLLLNLGNNLLNTSRVDTTVSYKLVKCKTCNLTTYWIKTAEDNSLWSIVNDNLNTCCSLKCTDITTLTTDNTTLDSLGN